MFRSVSPSKLGATGKASSALSKTKRGMNWVGSHLPSGESGLGTSWTLGVTPLWAWTPV
ncbi:hypothetical protein D3C72_1331660 [compost metagenome]